MKTIFDEAATLVCGGTRPMTVVAAEAVESIGSLGGHAGMWGLLIHHAKIAPAEPTIHTEWALAELEDA